MKGIAKLLTFLAGVVAFTACADEKGEAVTEVSFCLEAKVEVESEALSGGNFVAANGDEIELKSLQFHLSEIELLSKTATGGNGEAVEFDPENPPEPYENCHANHCHIKGSSDVRSFAEIEAEMMGAEMVEKTVLTISTDETLTFEAFNQELMLEDFVSGDLDYGSISEVRVKFDVFTLEALNKAKGEQISLRNEHVHGTELHRESLLLSHPLEVVIDKNSPKKMDIDLVFELDGSFLDEIAEAEGEIDFADLIEEHALLEIGGEEHEHEHHHD